MDSNYLPIIILITCKSFTVVLSHSRRRLPNANWAFCTEFTTISFDTILQGVMASFDTALSTMHHAAVGRVVDRGKPGELTRER